MSTPPDYKPPLPFVARFFIWLILVLAIVLLVGTWWAFQALLPGPGVTEANVRRIHANCINDKRNLQDVIKIMGGPPAFKHSRGRGSAVCAWESNDGFVACVWISEYGFVEAADWMERSPQLTLAQQVRSRLGW